MANYSFGHTPLPEIENGHVFKDDNFCQLNPHTAIFAGKSGLKFIKCNLTNCDPPADSIYEGCSPYHVSFCSNERPKLIDHGLTPCETNCTHVVATDTITIDGVLVSTVYHYSAKVVI